MWFFLAGLDIIWWMRILPVKEMLNILYTSTFKGQSFCTEPSLWLIFTTAESVFLSVSLLLFQRGRPFFPSSSPPPSLFWGAVSGCLQKDVRRTADVLSAWIIAYCTAHFDGKRALTKTWNVGLWNTSWNEWSRVLQKNCVYTTRGCVLYSRHIVDL